MPSSSPAPTLPLRSAPSPVLPGAATRPRPVRSAPFGVLRGPRAMAQRELPFGPGGEVPSSAIDQAIGHAPRRAAERAADAEPAATSGVDRS